MKLNEEGIFKIKEKDKPKIIYDKIREKIKRSTGV